jgi:isopentenyl diphosphate isomerase/L-lactate dehydrogenase-like FMN-dependent dehydrogenase
MSRSASRRRLLQFLLASPLIEPAARAALLESPEEALSVFDFEAIAREKVPPAHFGRVATGSDDDLTLKANREDFAKVTIRPRRLRGISAVDSSITLFGEKWSSPVFICPTGAANAMHPDGYIGVSKAAEAGKHLQMFPLGVSTKIEDAIAARNGTPVWCQFYPFGSLDELRPVITRAERAGSPVLVLTIDGAAVPNFDTWVRMRREDKRTCSECHPSKEGQPPAVEAQARPHEAQILPALDWDFVRRLRDSTKLKVVLKGIMAPEDAVLSVKHGFDGIIVSNHGGRVGDFGASSISVLPDVLAAVRGRIPVLVDSGFRRGMDIVKAMAMGATAVGVGRPYLWGLGAFGQHGVERVLEILREETKTAMAEVGAATIKDLMPTLIHSGLV